MKHKSLIAGIVLFFAGNAIAQCTISGVTTPVCTNAPVQNFSSTGDYLFVDSVMGSTFDPSSATLGNHTVQSYSMANAWSYAVNTSGTYAPEPFTGTTAVSLADDQVSGALPIGFNFTFFGNSYSQFYISSNGFITFTGGQSSGCCSGGIIPSNDGVNNIISWDWNDLYPPGGGQIGYKTIGTAPNRILIVYYQTVSHCCGTDASNTGQIKLFEGSNIIEIHTTATTDDGSVATQGIENANGTIGFTTPGRNSQNWASGNHFVSFTPSVNYIVNSVGTFAPEVIAGTSVPLSDDQVSGAIPVGFDFNFFGNSYSQLFISSNGFVTFSSGQSSGCCSGGLLPSNDGVNNIVAWDWNDLYPPSTGTISYQTVGTAPNRRMIINYNTLSHCCGSDGSNTGQIKLFEGSNIIQLHVTSTTDDGSVATQGIENSGGTVGYAVTGRNSQNWSTSNNFVEFVPAGICAASTIVVNGTSTSTQTQTACGNYNWSVNGSNYTTSGTYTHTIPGGNVNGCDSIIQLDLTITMPTSSTSSATACSNYTWAQNGMTYSTSGLYYDTLTNAVGCDSIIELDLTITMPSSSTSSATACSNYTWAQNGMTYSTSGLYYDTIPNAMGCDSIIELDLTITSPSSSMSSVTACSNYTWAQNGQTYATSGVYYDTIPNAVGCDSIIGLNLLISNPSLTPIVQNACDSYTWSETGMTYTTSGSYQALYQNQYGCDSILELNLTINAAPAVVLVGTTQETVAGNGGADITVTGGGSYTYLWSNGATTEDLTNVVGGIYTVQVTNVSTGCQISFQVTVPSVVGINESALDLFMIHPNPTTGKFTVTLQKELPAMVNVYAANGSIVFSSKTSSKSIDVNLEHLANGVYNVEVINSEMKRNQQIVIQH